MKKRISVLIVIALIFSLSSSFGINAMCVEEPVNEEQIIKDITEVISQFYHSKDIAQKRMANGLYSSDVASYLSGKIETHQHVTELYNTEKENYKVDVKLLSKNSAASTNAVVFDFQVITTYNYVDCDFETTSSEVVKILYDYGTNKIVDFYTPMNYYDEYVRNEQAPTDKTLSEKFVVTASITNKQDSLLKEIDAKHSELHTKNILNKMNLQQSEV